MGLREEMVREPPFISMPGRVSGSRGRPLKRQEIAADGGLAEQRRRATEPWLWTKEVGSERKERYWADKETKGEKKNRLRMLNKYCCGHWSINSNHIRLHSHWPLLLSKHADRFACTLIQESWTEIHLWCSKKSDISKPGQLNLTLCTMCYSKWETHVWGLFCILGEPNWGFCCFCHTNWKDISYIYIWNYAINANIIFLSLNKSLNSLCFAAIMAIIVTICFFTFLLSKPTKHWCKNCIISHE